MGWGMNHEYCRAKAEVAPGVWNDCVRSGHFDGDHHVQHLDGSPLLWPAREGDIRRIDGLIYDSLQENRILQALRNLSEWGTYPGDANELVQDAKRRLRDAYKWLTGREPELQRGRS